MPCGYLLFRHTLPVFSLLCATVVGVGRAWLNGSYLGTLHVKSWLGLEFDFLSHLSGGELGSWLEPGRAWLLHVASPAVGAPHSVVTVCVPREGARQKLRHLLRSSL